eukprot:GHRR01000290.1.p2 GENE.GHRR01000290.1~~GHRR01000290.1.p2  ORF type:complete len:364 (-),score=-66.26 GHRR01000290.1:4664-5755(-)
MLEPRILKKTYMNISGSITNYESHSLLKTFFRLMNQQETNESFEFLKSIQVGSSETLCFLTKMKTNEMKKFENRKKKNLINKKMTIQTEKTIQQESKWNDWFAGLTDGDGCFYINKRENSVSFEVTTHLTDSRVVYDIKNHLKAGTVKVRSNAQAIRYRVKQKTVILDIVSRLNGKLHNPARLQQFSSICTLLNVELKPTPPLLNKKSAYLAGLIDSDGRITISVFNSSAENSQKSGIHGRLMRLVNSKAHNQITLNVTSIYKENIDLLKDSYGFGNVYEERPTKKAKSLKIKYHWVLRSNEDFTCVYDLIKTYPLKSVKMHRLRLSVLYFKYKLLKYHLASPETVEFKVWTKFCKSWFKYSF